LNPGKSEPLDANEEARDIEKTATNPPEPAPTRGRVSAPLGVQKPEPSDEDLESAIVAAMLDGRGAVAEVLAERLRERKHVRAGVVELDAGRVKRQ